MNVCIVVLQREYVSGAACRNNEAGKCRGWDVLEGKESMHVHSSLKEMLGNLVVVPLRIQAANVKGVGCISHCKFPWDSREPAKIKHIV